MVTDNKFTVVEDDSPERCQAVHGNGQCRYKVVMGSQYCPMHGGNRGAEALKAANLRNYRLSKWQQRVNEKADAGGVKNLREEIGILRMVLEEMVDRCGDPVDLVMNSAKIADLIIKIEKLVTSCHRLESNLGLMLDKQAAMQLSGEIVDIIGRHVKDDTAVAAIANDIGLVLSRIGSSGKEDSAGASS